MLGALFIAVAAVAAVLATIVLTKAEDPAVRYAGRFVPGLGTAAFLTLRVLGLQATVWIALGVGLGVAVFVMATLYERNVEDARELQSHAAGAVRALRSRLGRLARSAF